MKVKSTPRIQNPDKLYSLLDRRDFLKRSVWGGISLAAFVGLPIEDALAESLLKVNRNSSPSDLKITDLRCVTVDHLGRATTIIRLDTNQGIYGLGELREGRDKRLALMLKSKVIGENPCNVEKIFKSIKNLGGYGLRGTGVCAIEMALWDLAGKAFGVPCWQMLGGRYRDRIRLYTDFMGVSDFSEVEDRIKYRTQVEGFTWIKMTRIFNVIRSVEGGYLEETSRIISDRGIDKIVEYLSKVRDIVGYSFPVSADHFLSGSLNNMIRVCEAIDPIRLAWIEEPLHWTRTEDLRRLTEAVNTPTLVGENIYLKEQFIELCDARAIDIVHPDQASSGGLLETKKIGDYAEEKGIGMAQHFTGTAVSFMANVHIAAATQNSAVLEFHQEGKEIDQFNSMVNTVDGRPMLEKGFALVPDESPGLGIELDEEGIKANLHPSDRSYFAPTLEWNEWVTPQLK